MKASLLDLRRNTKQIVAAIERRQSVTVTRRGKTIARIDPVSATGRDTARVDEHAAFGMWSDHGELADVPTSVRKLREGRFGDL